MKGNYKQRLARNFRKIKEDKEGDVEEVEAIETEKVNLVLVVSSKLIRIT